MKTRTNLRHTLITINQTTYARQVILRKINNKKHNMIENSYGEYLYGDHVDSPEYDDYLESNCGDQ